MALRRTRPALASSSAWAVLPADLLLAIASRSDDPARWAGWPLWGPWAQGSRPKAASSSSPPLTAAAARRLAVMRTCRRWRGVLLEEPEVWPMAVLRFPEPQWDIWHDSDEEPGCGDDCDGCTGCCSSLSYQELSRDRNATRRRQRRDVAAGAGVVRAAAQLDPRTVRVRLAGSGAQVGGRLAWHCCAALN